MRDDFFGYVNFFINGLGFLNDNIGVFVVLIDFIVVELGVFECGVVCEVCCDDEIVSFFDKGVCFVNYDM